MKFPKISELTLTELKKLQRDVAMTIEGYEARKKSEALAELQERAKELGFNLVDLMGMGKIRKSAAPGKPKYRHPENPEITWSGKGRRPNWFLAAVEAGATAESMAV